VSNSGSSNVGVGSVQLFDAAGAPIGQFQGLRLKGFNIRFLGGGNIEIEPDLSAGDIVEVQDDGVSLGNFGTLDFLGQKLVALGGGVVSITPATIFDDNVESAYSNVRSSRTVQSPIDNTKTGITNLGSRSAGATTGVTADYGTVGGGDQNAVSGVGGVVPGGVANLASGLYAYAMGVAATASATAAASIGFLTLASGNGSLATNVLTNARGFATRAAGSQASADRYGEDAHSSQGENGFEGKHEIDLYADLDAASGNLLMGDGAELMMNGLRSLVIEVDILGSRVGVQGNGYDTYKISAHSDGTTLTLDNVTQVAPAPQGGFVATWTVAITAVAASLTLRIAINPGAQHVKFGARVRWSALPGVG